MFIVLKSQKGIAPIIIILIIIGILVIGGGAWYYLIKITPIGPGSCPTDVKICPDGTSVNRISPKCEFAQCPETKDETASWQIYRNETLGVEFKYPSELGVPKTEIRDYTKKQEQDFAGNAIEVFFIADTYTGKVNLVFGGYSSDYKARAVSNFTGNNDILSACPHQLTYDNMGNVCKIIQFPLGKAVLENEFWQAEGSFGFNTNIYFNNSTNSKYKGLEFIISLNDINKKIGEGYDFTSGTQSRAYAEAVRQSKNIMKGINLSQNDEKELGILEKIVSTFKFTK